MIDQCLPFIPYFQFDDWSVQVHFRKTSFNKFVEYVESENYHYVWILHNILPSVNITFNLIMYMYTIHKLAS